MWCVDVYQDLKCRNLATGGAAVRNRFPNAFSDVVYRVLGLNLCVGFNDRPVRHSAALMCILA